MERSLKSKVRVLPDSDALARAAAELFKTTVLDNVSAKGSFTAALSGGSTPTTLFALLASDEYRNDIPWRSVHIFWADERCVPPTDRRSNYGAAQKTLLGKVDIPAENIHRIPGELGPDEGAKTYDAELKRHFGKEGMPVFDLIMLGIGADGHTASLFPGSETAANLEKAVVPVTGAGIDPPRVSLTLSVINNALNVVFLVSGAGKAETVRDVLSGTHGLPAGLVNPTRGKLTWLLDAGAAARLSEQTS